MSQPISVTMFGSLIVHAIPMLVAEVRDRALAEAGEPLGGDRIGPAAGVAGDARATGGGPAWREKWWNVTTGSRPALAARGDHPAVVVERGGRELALLGFDARPLEREPVRAEAEPGQQVEVGRVAPEVVAGVARHLVARGARRVLPRPPVVVPVAALDLMGRGGRAPEEPVRKRARRHGARMLRAAARRRGRSPDDGLRNRPGTGRAVTNGERADARGHRREHDGSARGAVQPADAAAATTAPPMPVPSAVPSPSVSCTDAVADPSVPSGASVSTTRLVGLYDRPMPSPPTPQTAAATQAGTALDQHGRAREDDADGEEHDAGSPLCAGCNGAVVRACIHAPIVHVIVAGVSARPTSTADRSRCSASANARKASAPKNANVVRPRVATAAGMPLRRSERPGGA